MEVKIEHRNQEVEYLRMVLNLCELNVNYTQADMIIRAMDKLKEKSGNLSIEDGMNLFYRWKKDYQSYFEIQMEEEQKRKNN